LDYGPVLNFFPPAARGCHWFKRSFHRPHHSALIPPRWLEGLPLKVKKRPPIFFPQAKNNEIEFLFCPVGSSHMGIKLARSRRNRARLEKNRWVILGARFDSPPRPFIEVRSFEKKKHFFCVGWPQGLMEPHRPKNCKKKHLPARAMPATRLAAMLPLMPLARSRLRPATGPPTEPVRARAKGAGGGPHPPSHTRPAAPSASHRNRRRSHHHHW